MQPSQVKVHFGAVDLQCVDRLEKLGDRALHACTQAGNTVDEQVRAAVKEAHDAIADLKHRLH